MTTVCVAARQAFRECGITAAQGEVIELPPLIAAILARKQLISLDRHLVSRQRHTYRRRDLVPEQP